MRLLYHSKEQLSIKESPETVFLTYNINMLPGGNKGCSVDL